MVHPEIGVAANEEFFSLAVCKKWIDAHLPKFNAAEHRKFLPAPEEKISQEERERRVSMAMESNRVIRETAQRICITEPKELERQAAERLKRSQREHSLAELVNTPLMRGESVA